MSTYSVFCLKNKPHRTVIDLPLQSAIMSSGRTVRLKLLNKMFYPKFYYKTNKEYFYYVEYFLNRERIAPPNVGAPEWEVLAWKIHEEESSLFDAAFNWALSELTFGNSVSIICQVETDDGIERERYNEIYEKKEISLSDISDTSKKIVFDFNTEYEIITS